MLFTGVTGNLSITRPSGTKQNMAHMANWSVDVSKDIIEVVSFGNSYKEKIGSIKDWSASCDGKVDFAQNGGQQALLDSFEAANEQVDAVFYLDEGTFFSGKALIESLSISTSADGAAEISISIAGSGPLVQTLAA